MLETSRSGVPVGGGDDLVAVGRTSLRSLLAMWVPPAILALCFVWYFWKVTVPFWDQFSMSLIFDKFYSSQLHFGDFWEPFNGHRVPVQRLISLSLGALTRWNVALEALISNLLNVAIFILIVRELKLSAARRGRVSPAVLLFLSMMCFSLNQYENWFNGWDLMMLLSELCSVGAFLLLCREPPVIAYVAGAAALAITSSFSFGAGVATWPVGVIAILLNPPRRKILALVMWIACGLVTVLLYASQSPPDAPRTLSDVFRIPIYFASYLGSPLFSINGEKAVSLGAIGQHLISFVAPAIGLLAIPAVALLYVQARRIGSAGRAINFPLMLCLFAIASAALTSVARTRLGRTQAMAPHYITVSRLLWIGAAMLYAIAKRDGLQRLRPAWVAGGTVVMAVLIAASYANGARHLRDWHREQLTAQAQLLTRYDDVTLRNLCPSLTLPELRQCAEALKKHHLALYAHRQIDSTVGVYVPSAQVDAP